MNVSQLEGERALEVLADILDPASEILTDSDIVQIMKESKKPIDWIKVILKKQAKNVIRIMAILDGEDPDTYKVNLLTLPVKLLNLFNNPEVLGLFTPQGQENTENISSGSVMGNTGE